MGHSTNDIESGQSLEVVSEEESGRVETGTPSIFLPRRMFPRPSLKYLSPFRSRQGSSQSTKIPNLHPADVPKVLFLGPIHGPSKQETIQTSLLSVSDEDPNFRKLVDNIKRDQHKIQKWYDPCEYSCKGEDLVRMMARDGLCLLQILRDLSSMPEPTTSRFTRSFKDISRDSIAFREDVMKMSNQIPIFVLKKIFQAHTHGSDTGTDQDLNSILTNALVHLSPIRCRCESRDSHVKAGAGAGAGARVRDHWHLLEFVYGNIISSSYHHRRKKKTTNSSSTLPSAVKLTEKNVKFEQEKGPFDKIRFDGGEGTLYLPAIEMNARTAVILRNLLKFEASKKRTPLMCYVDLMGRLIKDTNDNEVLTTSGIIQNHLGTDDDVLKVWNEMRELLDGNIAYEPIDKAVRRVITFSKFPGLNKYWSKQWIVKISAISASILLVLTFIIMVLTVLQTILSWKLVRLQLQSMKKG